jgi:hypothetical protein
MSRSLRLRLLTLTFTLLAITAGLAPVASAAPSPICWYNVSCVHDCSLSCGGNQDCQHQCNEEYCKVCP